jgi:hypothetical protein
MTFSPFDPLEFKSTNVNDAALGAMKREITNILSSYVGWYDPFCELIQNALDSVDARRQLEKSAGDLGAYEPLVRVTVDLDANALTVTDNGIGLDQDRFQQFLAPNFSFKTGDTRGHKGVGATYVAYGFNYMRVSTKAPGFDASGRIVGARTWVTSDATGGNPKVEPDDSPLADNTFATIDRGVSITVRFDEKTQPRKLDWLGARSAEVWLEVLSIKTGFGSVREDDEIRILVDVVDEKVKSSVEQIGTQYYWLHDHGGKSARLRDVEAKAAEIFQQYGEERKLPSKFTGLDFLFDSWSSDELATHFASYMDDDDLEVLEKFKPTVAFEYGFSATLWTKYNDGLGIRRSYRALSAGIQLAANNMPQGEVMQVPLVRNVGRQNQVHFLIHFENYTPDLGRKGFHRELTDFAKTVSRAAMDTLIARRRTSMRANTGAAPDVLREMKIDAWKKEMLEHEQIEPLVLASPHFFAPTERISLTSTPTREQDVIALFHQLVAGGVIRGIRVMSTNERFTYDGLFRIAFDLSSELYEYDPDANPLGVSSDVLVGLEGKISEPRILEYKYSLDGLIEDFDSQDKNINDLSLCIAWETGTLYEERYGITSLLNPDNADLRQYHGVTHTLTDIESGAKHCDLIILSELIQYLNDPNESLVSQEEKYG